MTVLRRVPRQSQGFNFGLAVAIATRRAAMSAIPYLYG